MHNNDRRHEHDNGISESAFNFLFRQGTLFQIVSHAFQKPYPGCRSCSRQQWCRQYMVVNSLGNLAKASNKEAPPREAGNDVIQNAGKDLLFFTWVLK